MSTRTAILLGLAFALLACGGRKGHVLNPDDLAATGMEPTREWLEYNARATANGLAQLGYAVLCTAVSDDGRPLRMVSAFSEDDPQAYLFARLDNVNIGDTCTIAWRDPRGALHYEARRSYTGKGRTWYLWPSIYVKGVAARLPGEWALTLSINDTPVLSRKVLIGEPGREYARPERPEGAPAIAFRPLVAQGTAGPKYRSRVPLILQQRFAIDHPEFACLAPGATGALLPLSKEVSGPDIGKELARSPQVKELVKKRGVRLIVAGLAQGAWTEQDVNRIEIWLLDARTGRTRHLDFRYNLPPVQADRSFHDWMAMVGGRIYEQMMAEHGDFVLAALTR